jgi:UDP-GlcNAc:undecaprenyl-phosphate/decaprenyl-phosphate GlcNAc-1-phosphate transferase
MTPAISALVYAFALVLGLVPILMWVARSVGLVDKPDNTRKLHLNSIPLVGGIAVFIGSLAAASFALWQSGLEISPENRYELIGLVLGLTAIILIGVLDDRFALRGRQKLIGQIAAVTILYVFGYRFEVIEIMGFQVHFGIFSIVVVYFWCLAAINSVNLLDGADGFATVVGAVMSFAMSYMAFYMQQDIDGIICLAFGGALVAFLFFNFPPAKAYLGDAGSMLIGLFFAAISIRCAFKQQLAYAVFAPITLLAIPLIDTSAAIIRRRLTGKSIYTEDRGHLHHVLAKRGLSPRKSLLFVTFFSLMTATGGALALRLGRAEFALASIGMVLFLLVAFKVFGVAEFKLLSRKLIQIARSFLIVPKRTRVKLAEESSLSLQGDEDWAEVWGQFRKFAEQHELTQIILDVNAPWRHESYHARWRQASFNASANHNWQVEMPIIVESRIWGRVQIFAPRVTKVSHHEIILDLLEMISVCEKEIAKDSSLHQVSQHLQLISVEDDTPNGSAFSAR